MSTHFDKNPESMTRYLPQALGYHPDLVNCGVQVLIVDVRKINAAGEFDDSVKIAGSPCAARVKVLSQKQRLLTGFDAEIMVDGHRWDDYTEESRVALLDHELNHLQVMRDDANKVKLDDLGRPRLGTIPDDFMLTGFLCVIERHGEAALESQSVRIVHLRVMAALEASGKVLADNIEQFAQAEEAVAAV